VDPSAGLDAVELEIRKQLKNKSDYEPQKRLDTRTDRPTEDRSLRDLSCTLVSFTVK
jgi:hypothetical protein